jgi:hypothetical protein
MSSSKPAPSALARAIYRILLGAVRAGARGSTSITYGELAAALRAGGFTSMYPRNQQMHAALTEVTEACHARRVPILPAIVWRRDTARPGDTYFIVAHPAARTPESKLRAWKREHDRVTAARALPRSL